ncbi:MAG: hypothetical protein ABF335_04945 [Alphaproteobacteria bacterium]
MDYEYPALLIVHLMCATLFIGIVFFEVVILEGIRKNLPEAVMAQVEKNLIMRARKVMPYVVALLFLTGISMVVTAHWEAITDPLATSFGTLLAIKITLAVSVLVHFINAQLKVEDGCMSSRRFELTHLSVAIHMVFIVILAKGMYYFTW